MAMTDRPANGDEGPSAHHHDHDHTEPPSETELRVKALESLLDQFC